MLTEAADAIRTPDTTVYMVAAYAAIGTVLGAYALSLLVRLRKAKEA